MTIILPILIAAALLGLFVRRVTTVHWIGLASWISLVIAYHYLKP